MSESVLFAWKKKNKEKEKKKQSIFTIVLYEAYWYTENERAIPTLPEVPALFAEVPH